MPECDPDSERMTARFHLRFPPLRLHFSIVKPPTVEQALKDLQLNQSIARKQRLVTLNQNFVELVEQLRDQLAQGQSLDRSETLRTARNTLVEMHNLFTSVFAKARVRRAVANGMDGLQLLTGFHWDNDAMRQSAIQMLQVLHREFSSHTFN